MPRNFDVQWEEEPTKSASRFDVQWESGPDGDTLNEQHPEVDRAKIMNLAPSHQAAVEHLKKQGFEVRERGGDYDLDIRKPGEKQFRKLDPEGFDRGDITDIISDTAKGVIAGGAGTIAGGASLATGPGAIAAGMGGAALGGGLAESARQILSRLVGFEDTAGSTAKEIGKEALISGAGEGVLRGVASVAKPLIKKAGTANVLKWPLKLEHHITGQGKKLAAKEADTAVKMAKGELSAAQKALIDEGEQAMVRGAARAPEQAAMKAPAREAAETGAGSWGEAASRATGQAAEAALSSGENSSMRFITGMLHPARGVRAENLQYVPGLHKVWQEALGRDFRNPIGSLSMENAEKFLGDFARGKTQTELDKLAVNLAQKTGEWMRANIANLTDIEKATAKRLAQGTPLENDATIASEAINRTIFDHIDELRPLAKKLKMRRLEKDVAVGKAAEGTPWSRTADTVFAGRGGRELRKWMGMGAVGTAGLITRAPYITGELAEWILKQGGKALPQGSRRGAPNVSAQAAARLLQALGQGSPR